MQKSLKIVLIDPNLYYEVRPKVNIDREIVKFIKSTQRKIWDYLLP